MNSSILLLCDFLEESTSALIHAAQIAHQKSCGIVMLHFLFPDEKREDAEAIMEKWKTKMSAHFSGPVKAIVDSGDLLQDIGPVAEREQCSMVVMPTHGMKGIQQMTGSLALNVITGAQIPFLIVQNNSANQTGYKKIVLPIECRQQLIEEADKYIEFAKLFESEVIGYIHDHSEAPHDSGIVLQLEELLKLAGVPFHIEKCAKFDFSKATTEFANSIQADLICAINYSYENLYTINPRTDEEDLIYNKSGIPVLLITPRNQDDDLIRPDFE